MKRLFGFKPDSRSLGGFTVVQVDWFFIDLVRKSGVFGN
jgi:hypothetical protein